MSQKLNKGITRLFHSDLNKISKKWQHINIWHMFNVELVSIMAKPYILQKVLFHWFCSKFLALQYGQRYLWTLSSWRLSEAKNSPLLKTAWRSGLFWTFCKMNPLNPLRFNNSHQRNWDKQSVYNFNFLSSKICDLMYYEYLLDC